MKKTLITLMALASCAMGVTLEDAAFVKGGNSGYDTQGNNFTVALTLDVAALRTVLERNQTSSWGTDIVKYICNGTATGVTVNGSVYSGTTNINNSGLYARWANDAAWNPNGASDVRWDGGTNLADLNGSVGGTGWDNIASAGLVYSFGATSGTAVSFTLIDTNGNAIVNSYVTAGDLKSQSAVAAALTFDDSVATSYYYNEYMGGNEANMKALAAAAAVATPVIPEPATATLSLLALCGLAARRRRK